MTPVWKLVLDEAAFQFFLSRTGAERRLLLSAFEQLRAELRQDPDYQTNDDTGRTHNVRTFRPFLVTYWLDAFVNEIRVVDIERVHSF